MRATETLLTAALSAVALLVLVCCPLSTSAAAKNAPEERLQQGAHVYNQGHCYVCPGQFGSGILGPKFAGDPLLKEKPYMISQILIGRGEMPAYAHRLSDEEIAAVAEYIRNSWGNDLGAVGRKTSRVQGRRSRRPHNRRQLQRSHNNPGLGAIFN
jgi:mono/diheme cytochrome c family protein